MTATDPADDTTIPTDASFEELQRELDAIVEKLERGDVHVDEAIKLWRRGEALYASCVKRLESAELSIEELQRPPVVRDNDAPTV